MAETDWKYLQYNVETGQKRTNDGPDAGSSSLADLDDTNISNPSDGQMLGYDSTEGKWKNVAAPAGSVTDVTLDGNTVVNGQGVAALTTPNVNDLKDTNISSPSNGQTLQYNATTQKWENATPASGGNVDDVKVNGTSVVTNKVANITSYKEVTQAQYEALPDTKLNDGVLYAIKDGGQAIEGFPPRIYSSEEREIGVWINGKPVYEKVIDCTEFSASANTWVDTGIDIPNGEYVVSCGFAQHNSISGAFLHIAFCKFDNFGNLLAYFADGTYYWSRCLIQYTKTTDIPGSGTWNQQGAIAHHYSTNEKIIGTWIDGKPLYEKTFSIPKSDMTGADMNIAHGISNLGKVIEITGTMLADNANPINTGYQWGTQWGCALGDVTSTTFYLRMGTSRYSNVTEAIVILRYTKTTD